MKGEPLKREMPDLVSKVDDADLLPLSPSDSHPGPSDPPRSLVDTIKCGIAKRGFYITNAKALEPLWAEGIVSFREKLRRLQYFAEAREWEVTSKDMLALVLFQPQGGSKLLSGGSSLGTDR